MREDGLQERPPGEPVPDAILAIAAPPVDEDWLAIESRLRAELATGAQPAAAALELAGVLCRQERPDEALPVLDAAIARADEPALHVARAGVLRDLGQRHASVTELRGLRSLVGVGGMHPGLLFELGELEWMEGDRAAATATVGDLQREHALHPWLRAHGASVTALADELRGEPGPRRLRLRDLLGNLRGCPDVRERLRALDTLVELGGEAAWKAITVGLLADEPLVRARAVQRFDTALPGASGVTVADVCREAIADSAPIVRAAAAGRLAVAGPAAVPVLLQALEQETDPDAFAATHAALLALSGDGPELPATAPADEPTRRAVAASWRSRWGR
jgi:hypothetical protein